MSIASPAPGDTKLVKPFLSYVDVRAGPVYYPEIGLQLGWDASAGAASQLPASGKVEFLAAPTIVGGIVGLGNDPVTDYGQLTHGLYLSRGVLRVIESGVLIASAGSFTDTDVLSIDVEATVVAYAKNGTVFYTSLVAAAGASHRAYAFLYAPDDAIYNLVLTPTVTGAQHGAGTATTSAALAFSADRPHVEGRALGVAASARGSSGLLAPGYVSGFADTPPAAVVIAGHRAPAAGYALTSGARVLAADVANYVTGYALTLAGTAGGTAGLAIPASVVEQLQTSDLFATLYEMRVTIFGALNLSTAAVGLVVLPQSIRELLHLTTNLQLIRWIETIAEQLNLTDLSAAHVGLIASVLEQLNAQDSFLARQVLHAVLVGALAIDAIERVSGATALNETWAVNTEKGPGARGQAGANASTRYLNYEFNSLTNFRGSAYGARADGIYLLEGDDDAGQPIRASMNFGKTNFGTSAKKRVAAAYLGVLSSGKLVMKVTREGESFLYTARSSADELKMQRFDFGKGLMGNYFEFELFNGPGESFELDTVEFLPVPLARRI